MRNLLTQMPPTSPSVTQQREYFYHPFKLMIDRPLSTRRYVQRTLPGAVCAHQKVSSPFEEVYSVIRMRVKYRDRGSCPHLRKTIENDSTRHTGAEAQIKCCRVRTARYVTVRE